MPTYFYHGWTDAEERELEKIMKAGFAARKKTNELFREASEKLNRTRYSCQNRWYDIKSRSKAV